MELADWDDRWRQDPYTLIVADFFDVTTEQVGRIDAVFDRASLEAATRIRYAAHLGSLQSPGAATLLITFDSDQSGMDGPPFAVSDDEVPSLFGEGFSVEHLATRDALDPHFADIGLDRMQESAYAITRR